MGVHKKRHSVGEKIREIRESKGMSPAELADKTGMLRQSIYKYERDITRTLPYSVVKTLADALDVNPSYLVGWSNSMERTPDIINTSEIQSNII